MRSFGPALVRATALVELAASPSPAPAKTIGEAVGSDEVLLRRAAADAAMSLPMPQRAALVLPLLSDPARSVRIAAVATLLGADTQSWTAPDRQALQRAIEEYRAAKLYNAGHAEALVDLAHLDLIEGEPERGRARLRRAIEREPSFTPA